MSPSHVTVDCGSCHACCKSLVLLFPERGDDVSRYLTQDLPDGRKALQRKPDGSCVHLGSEGCEVHPHHPAVCKVFDCAGFYASHTRAERRSLLARGMYSREIFEAGRARFGRQQAGARRLAALEVIRRMREQGRGA